MGATIGIEFLKLFENDWFLLSDLADMFIGKTIGEGNSRSVFEFNPSPKLVIKIDRTEGADNRMEWDIYQNLKDTDYGKYLAPCLRISSCARLLVMEKTKPVKLEEMPKSIPDFFTDYKLQNWGKIGNRIVCHDYANHKFFTPSRNKMIKPEWWSDTFQIVK